MKYLKQCAWIFGITAVGELLNTILPLPIPAGVYGLFILLIGLACGLIKLSDVENVSAFLLETMPIMFVPIITGLMESYEIMESVLLETVVISVVSTIVVMIAAAKACELIIRLTGRNKPSGNPDREKEAK